MPIQVVVGLGNPGPRYADTRHNVGYWFADCLAAEYGGTFRRASRFHGDLVQLDCGGKFWLLKPETFMNHSGQSLLALAHYYRIPPDRILVVHDDLDLPPGSVRLKRGGGHGGHNGLRDIVACLGSRDFQRLRIGIGHPGDSNQVVDYVLNRASREDEEQFHAVIDASIKVFPRILEGSFEKAMNVLHSKKLQTTD
ncbi:MAG: aminoacyl-tRNA hydrolase [Gammaproteobacteria bacterium]|nr:aminoacyl-tRNA hydrolase [Gammaproteobacteria bacterium]